MNAILVNIAIKVNYVNRNCKLLNFQVKKIFGLLKIKVATQPISMAHGFPPPHPQKKVLV